VKGPGRRARFVGVLAVSLSSVVLLLPPSPAYASAPGLSISVPSTVSFGSFSAGARTISAHLGTVTVTTASTLVHDASWSATVSTTAFKTGGGTGPETVAAAAVSYLAGVATAQSGLAVGACTPGQLTAVSLSSAVTAFSCSGISVSSSTSLSWNPLVSISIGAGNVVGTYSGTITHSVV
jgi:hypothetical protein